MSPEASICDAPTVSGHVYASLKPPVDRYNIARRIPTTSSKQTRLLVVTSHDSKGLCVNIGLGRGAMGKFTDISHVVSVRRWGLLPFNIHVRYRDIDIRFDQ